MHACLNASVYVCVSARARARVCVCMLTRMRAQEIGVVVKVSETGKERVGRE